jgi:uracil phosphoribosyltransferase
MIKTHNLSKSNSVFNRFISEIRDVGIQKDPLRFRRNLERLGEVFAYEISKELNYSGVSVTTPLGEAMVNLPTEEPVLATILRAGLPLHNGMLNYFDRAENAFISAYRKHNKNDDQFEVQVEYLSSPGIDDKVLILTDPMLATGSSMVLVYQAMLRKGKPRHVHIVAAIASVEGLNFVKRNMPPNCTIWVGAVDDELTVQSYIVPGLGDAGDLAYGKKS